MHNAPRPHVQATHKLSPLLEGTRGQVKNSLDLFKLMGQVLSAITQAIIFVIDSKNINSKNRTGGSQ